jgi:hypothetical protein
MEIEGATEGEGEERNKYRNGASEEVSQFTVEVAKKHAESERKSRAHDYLPGKSGKAGNAHRDHREKRARLQGHDRIGGRFFGSAVLLHESHI